MGLDRKDAFKVFGCLETEPYEKANLSVSPSFVRPTKLPISRFADDWVRQEASLSQRLKGVRKLSLANLSVTTSLAHH